VPSFRIKVSVRSDYKIRNELTMPDCTLVPTLPPVSPMVRVIENAPYVHFSEGLIHFVVVVHHEVNGGMCTGLPLFKCTEKL
jgi:hypothetical protein